MKLFFHESVVFDPDEIWIRPGYVKSSPWSALKGCNNGFVICDDLGRKSGKIWESWRFWFLSWKLNFFSNIENQCLGVKKSKTVIMSWKPMPWTYFQTIGMIRKNKKMKKHFLLFFISDFFYAIFIKKWCLTLENFFSAISKNFSIGHMKNPKSFLISNRGQRTRFHFEILGLEARKRKSLRISPRSESYYQSFAEVHNHM